MSQSPAPKRAPVPLPEPVATALAALIRRRRRMVALRGTLIVGACFLGALLLVMALDAALTVFSAVTRWAMTLWVLGLTGAAAWRFLWRPLARRETLEQAALAADARHPEFEERIISAVELAGRDAEGSARLIATLAEEARDAAQGLEPRQEFSLRALRPFALAAAAAAAPLCLALILAPRASGRLLVRALAPSSSVGSAGSLGLQVTPGSARVARGAALDIRLSAPRPDLARAVLHLRRGTGPERPVDMPRMPGDPGPLSEFVLALPAVEESFTYRIRAGRAVTATYTVTAVDPPRLAQLSARLRPPPYAGTNAAALTLDPANPGEVAGLSGSRLTLRARTVAPAQTAELRVGGTNAPPPLVTSGGTGTQFEWTFDLPPGTNTPWSLQIADESGFRGPAVGSTLVSRPDARPEVALISPAGGTIPVRPGDRIPLIFLARDDVALQELVLVLTPQNAAPQSVAQPLAGGPRRVVELDLALLELGAARAVTAQIRARDGRPEALGGPQQTESAAVTFAMQAGAASYLERALLGWRQLIEAELRRAVAELAAARHELNELGRLPPTPEVPPPLALRLPTAMRQIRAAGGIVTELAGRLERTDFQPLAAPLNEAVSTHLEPAVEALHLVQSDAPEERVPRVRTADAKVLRAMTLLQNIVEQAQRILEEAARKRTLDELARQERELAGKSAGAKEDAPADRNAAAKQRELTDEMLRVLHQSPAWYAGVLGEKLGQVEALRAKLEQHKAWQEALNGICAEARTHTYPAPGAAQEIPRDVAASLQSRLQPLLERLGGERPSAPPPVWPGLATAQGTLRTRGEALETEGGALMDVMARLDLWRPLQEAIAAFRGPMRQAAQQTRAAAEGLKPAAEAGAPPAERVTAAVAQQGQAAAQLLAALQALARVEDIVAALQSGQSALAARQKAERSAQTASQAADLTEKRQGLLGDKRASLDAAVQEAKAAAQLAAQKATESAAAAQQAQQAALQANRAAADEARKRAEEAAEEALKAAERAREQARQADEAVKDETGEKKKEKKPPLHFQASSGGGSGTGSGTEGTGFAIAGSAPGSPLKEPPPPPAPRDASEAMDQAVTAETAPNAKKASEAMLQFSQSLDMMAGMGPAESSENTIIMPGAEQTMSEMGLDESQAGESAESSEGGESGESGTGGTGGMPKGGGKWTPGAGKGARLAQGSLAPQDFGVTDDDWLKLPGELRKDLQQAAESRAPEEFRDLIRDYFIEITRKGGAQ